MGTKTTEVLEKEEVRDITKTVETPENGEKETIESFEKKEEDTTFQTIEASEKPEENNKDDTEKITWLVSPNLTNDKLTELTEIIEDLNVDKDKDVEIKMFEIKEKEAE